ncbi:CoA ester lyase [Williamsia sp. CHRR-6]|nr:CoA ester lyase [Williamsia sp. CHRR-6]
MAKAAGCGADEVVFDLEDAVATERKTSAREALSRFVRTWDQPAGGPALSVRINPIGTQWGAADLDVALAAPAVSSVVVPKVESAADIELVGRRIDRSGRAGCGIQALIESAAGLAALHQIARCSSRLRSLIIGYADLAASLERPLDAPGEVWSGVQDRVLLAARVAGIDVIDGPVLSVADDDALRAAAVRARQMGLDGKWVIHPAQIATVTAVFTPADAEVRRARAIVDALDAGVHGGAGAIAHDGVMIDEAVARSARRVLARAAI